MNTPLDSQFWNDAFWTDRRVLTLVVGVVAFLVLMVAVFLYACLQMPGSVQPCAVGKVPPQVPPPAKPPAPAAMPPTPEQPLPLTPQWLAEQDPPAVAGPPAVCPEACPVTCQESCPVASEVAVPCACSGECTCQAEKVDPCPCSELVISPPTCKPSKNCRPRGRLFRSRH